MAMRTHALDLEVQRFCCTALGSLALDADNRITIATLGGIADVLHRPFLESKDICPNADSQLENTDQVGSRKICVRTK